MRKIIVVLLVVLGVIVGWIAASGPSGDSPYKTWVRVGLHADFYHSWRGATRDREPSVRCHPTRSPAGS